MSIYDHAQGLACDTGWNNCSIAHLLAEFIDQDQRRLERAKRFLDKQAREEVERMNVMIGDDE